MAKNLFVAGLDYSVTDDQLHELFSQFGTVESAKVIMDRETDRSKGFGFVEMSSKEEAINATQALDQTDFQGRTLMVKEARPKGEQSNNRFNNNDRKGGKNRFNKRDNVRHDW